MIDVVRHLPWWGQFPELSQARSRGGLAERYFLNFFCGFQT
jgi:hypothetical protein